MPLKAVETGRAPAEDIERQGRIDEERTRGLYVPQNEDAIGGRVAKREANACASGKRQRCLPIILQGQIDSGLGSPARPSRWELSKPRRSGNTGVSGSTSRGLLGASFGAVASLHTAWLFPGFFGRLLLQSGSFAYQGEDETRHGAKFEPVIAFQRLFRASPRRPSERVYVSCGLYEPLVEQNRELVPLLRETGMEVHYTEARDGHNWEIWRDRLLEGLSHLFPGPAVSAKI